MSLLYYYEYDSLFSGYACVPVHTTTRDPVREVEVDLPGLRPQRRRGHHEGQARGVFRISLSPPPSLRELREEEKIG